MRKMFVIPALVAVSAAIPLIAAGTAASQVAAPAVVAPAPAGWLGLDEIVSRLATAGWTVLKIEAEPDDANYKACVVGAGGAQVEARIDPLSGAIQSQEAKPCLGGSSDDDRHSSDDSEDASDDSRDSSDDSEDASDDSRDSSDDSRSD